MNGKLRDRLRVAAGRRPRTSSLALALASERVRAHLAGEPRKTIVVPGKLVNLVG